MIYVRAQYQHLWYLRTFFAVERLVALDQRSLTIGCNVTVDEYSAVFPDNVGWLRTAQEHYGSNSVVTVLRKLGYTGRGLDLMCASMHLCFAGQLRALPLEQIKRASALKLRRATRDHMNGAFFGHPFRVFADVCAR